MPWFINIAGNMLHPFGVAHGKAEEVGVFGKPLALRGFAKGIRKVILGAAKVYRRPQLVLRLPRAGAEAVGCRLAMFFRIAVKESHLVGVASVGRENGKRYPVFLGRL